MVFYSDQRQLVHWLPVSKTYNIKTDILWLQMSRNDVPLVTVADRSAQIKVLLFPSISSNNTRVPPLFLLRLGLMSASVGSNSTSL